MPSTSTPDARVCPDCGAALLQERDGEWCSACGYCCPCGACLACGRQHVNFEHVAPAGTFCFRFAPVVGAIKPNAEDAAKLVLRPLPGWLLAHAVYGGEETRVALLDELEQRLREPCAPEDRMRARAIVRELRHA